MKLPIAAIAVFAGLFVLSGCAGAEDISADTSPTASVSAPTPVTTSVPPSILPTTAVPPAPVTTTVEPVETYVEPAPVYEEPYIVECQHGGGLGPIATSWSDGSETGWSAYCQSVHDQALQSEVEASTPTCETDVCVHPNGATVPNPNYRVVQTPSPWVQGQIDWQNCLGAGNTREFCRATLN
ncbi:hypothetical protein [Rhodococcoides yunnanense]|uniref:hypothetical protein n=1 Tax=Rhodococcoides yunnanense TaxID=278209 RepID=UPI000ADDBC9F|nr:hypothetical protein [Rhodococcus yunnanensis]